MEVFSLYAPPIQEYIYQNAWDKLRSVQVAAGDAIFSTDKHVLICAATASGKTEAAFFPILTDFYHDPPQSVGALYISPLKALINDQFIRLNDICREMEIPVWHWHGDVSQTHKQKLLKKPSGILQITPESLEALLIHKNNYIPKLFSDLRYIVMDEVHSLLRADRGRQTLCLIERLSRLASVNPRRIALSATVGSPQLTAQLLSAGTDRETVIPLMEEKPTKWRLSMEHFFIGTDESKRTATAEEKKTDIAPKQGDSGISYIFEHTKNKKCLVFVNSREECEVVTATLRTYCEQTNQKDRFLIHHGNLSSSFRESAESIMKDEEYNLTTVTTATLELGIDIGRLQRAFQIDAPYTVSSFLQRMGRTGRRNEPPEMWFVMREEIPESRATLPNIIPWKLLQGIALVQAYRCEKFIEPTNVRHLPYSLLYHQTMSELRSCGEMTPAQLANRILTLPVFYRITTDDYKELLHHLIKINHIQQTEEKKLIVGLEGEKVVNTFKFYAVFQENEEYTVRSGSCEIGTIVMPPPVGEKIALAGHVWVVEEIDHKRRLLYCEQVKGSIPAYFGECLGDIHTKILEGMRSVLAEKTEYPYCMHNAKKRLMQARKTAEKTGMCQNHLVHLGGSMWVLFPWLGTYAFLALERFLKLQCKDLGLSAIESYRPYFIQFKMKATPQTFKDTLLNKLRQPIEPMDLLYPTEVPYFEKYDKYIPPHLVRKGFAYGILDVEEMKEKILSW